MVCDALQQQPPLHILNARACVPAEVPKFEHLSRPLAGPAHRAADCRPFVRRTLRGVPRSCRP